MVLRLSLMITLALVGWGLAAPDHLAATTREGLSATLNGFGWYYLLLVFGVVVLAPVLAFGRFGRIRLDGEGARPEFSRPAWLAMLFSAGMGIGLVFWGAAEPIAHFAAPPGYIEAGTPAAARFALGTAFFHWGLHPWALYGVVALALAFSRYNAGAQSLLSAACRPVIGRHADGWAGRVIDTLAVVATVIGVATSLGLGALQIGSGLHHVFGVPQGAGTTLAIIGGAAVLYLLSAASGLDRGIKWLSSANMVLAGVLAVAVFVLGPSVFLLDALTSTLGAYLGGFIQQSLRMTPFHGGNWTIDWTVFYWAWWVSWAPFVGLFIARISRGRTVREFMGGVVLVPAFMSVLWFAVFGGSALHLQMGDGVALQGLPAETVLFHVLDALPGGALWSVLAIAVVGVFFVTSADSATFVLGMLTTGGSPQPHAAVRLLWGVLMAAIAAVLLLGGGLKGLQTMAILAALPFSAVLIVLCLSLWRALSQAADALEAGERTRQARLEALVARLTPDELAQIETPLRAPASPAD